MTYAALMGAHVKRKEDPRLITGKGTYVADLLLPGMQHVAFVRSPYAHARIGAIDTSAAARRPGVVAVLTGADMVPLYAPLPMSTSNESGSDHEAEFSGQTHFALSVGRVRYVGEAVAVVIASTAASATDAATEVLVDWEPLPAVVGPLEALAEDAPRLFDNLPSNVEHTWQCCSEGVEAAFSTAEHIVQARIVSQRLAGVPLECRAVVATPDPTTDGVTVWSSTQSPHLNRTSLAEVLRLPENAVRVIAPDVGGGFGVKIGMYPEDAILAVLARTYELPLRWVESRMEHMMATTHGRAQEADVAAAVSTDGTIHAIRLNILADLGAYPLAPFIPELTGMMAVGVYAIPAVDINVTCVFTNTTPVAAYRGAGRPEAAYYIERLMDLIADQLQIDPAELRARNFIAPAAFPYLTPTQQLYDSGEYERALRKVLEIADYPALRAEQRQRRAASDERLLGIGMACYVEMCGIGPFESALVRVEPGGSVTVFTGIAPQGQGQATTFAQIVADQLGADYERVVVRYGDTRDTPMGRGTMASRGLAVGGAALVRAVAKVRDKAQRITAQLLEAAPEDIELCAGRYQVRGVPGRALTLAQIAACAYNGQIGDELEPGLEASDFFRPPNLVYPFGAHVAVVEIDRETGLVELRAHFCVDDCGPRISPTLVEGQIHGGLAQGIAQALYEEVVYDESGQLLTGSLMDYALPRAAQFPRFVLDRTETPTPHNPLGVKGVGEAATIGSTPAVANAVLDALKPFGVRHIDLPLRPEKIWRAMQTAQQDTSRPPRPDSADRL